MGGEGDRGSGEVRGEVSVMCGVDVGVCGGVIGVRGVCRMMSACV